MTYDVASQLQYTNVAYRTKSGLPKGATIASGGCGPSSVRNLGNNLLGWNTTVPAVAQIAVDCGARYNGGTTISTLLAAMKKKYDGFTYEYTTSDATAIAAVKAGAMAIIHTAGAVGGTYNKLLSTSGHFLCLAAVSGTTATIIDSCVTTGKWTANSVRKKYIKTTNQIGVVKCSTTALSAAVDYYYIVKKAAKTTTTTTPANKEDEEMVESTPHVINGKMTNINAITKDGVTYTCLKDLCAILGLKLSYDSMTKRRVVELNNIEITMDNGTINVPGTFVNSDTHLAAVGPMLREMGYDVGCTEAYKITATLPDTMKGQEVQHDG